MKKYFIGIGMALVIIMVGVIGNTMREHNRPEDVETIWTAADIAVAYMAIECPDIVYDDYVIWSIGDVDRGEDYMRVYYLNEGTVCYTVGVDMSYYAEVMERHNWDS